MTMQAFISMFMVLASKLQSWLSGFVAEGSFLSNTWEKMRDFAEEAVKLPTKIEFLPISVTASRVGYAVVAAIMVFLAFRLIIKVHKIFWGIVLMTIAVVAAFIVLSSFFTEML